MCSTFKEPMLRTTASILLILTILTMVAVCQETVFNVPSGDILNKGKVYAELDSTFHASPFLFTTEPRLVFGAGHNIELGVNILNIQSPGPSQAIISPTIKWRLWSKKEWSFIAGDNIIIPAQKKTYGIGNYAYASLFYTWKRGTRIGAGAYHFSPNVVAPRQRAGGQFTFEQPLNSWVTVAADWFTGAHASGYFTPGAFFKITKQLTLFTSYEIGNKNVTKGNHQFELELGWNFN